MTTRQTTKSELEQLIRLLNRAGDPELKRVYPEVGCYYLMGAYGGQKLVQIISEGGGVRDVLPHIGYASKRAVADGIKSYLDGRSEASSEQHYRINEIRAAVRDMQAAIKVG